MMWHIYNGNFWGMNFVWWIIWILLLAWIFIVPWNIPGQRTKKDTTLDILRKRFASGEISKEEYEEKKKILQQNS